MTLTDVAIAELERTITRLVAYRDKAKETDYYVAGPDHAAALRATMDATRILARWRLAPAQCYPKKVK